jgi:hypothetical protein
MKNRIFSLNTNFFIKEKKFTVIPNNLFQKLNPKLCQMMIEMLIE